MPAEVQHARRALLSFKPKKTLITVGTHKSFFRACVFEGVDPAPSSYCGDVVSYVRIRSSC